MGRWGLQIDIDGLKPQKSMGKSFYYYKGLLQGLQINTKKVF